MHSLIALIVVSWLCFVASSVCAFLLAFSFKQAQRKKYPFLRKLDGKKPYIAAAGVLCMALGYAS